MAFPGWLFVSFSCVLFASLLQGSLYDPCRSLTKCGDCIRVPNCVWCAKSDIVQSNATRCQLRDQMSYDCPSGFLLDPLPNYTIISGAPVTRAISKATTLSPQRASLTNLRLGHVFNISLQFKVVENYPADLYYLMDVSHSMYDDKKNLVNLTNLLVDTNDFRMGFGSFIDKNVLPFVESTGPLCGSASVGIGCGITYSFQHRLSLSDNVKDFITIVNSTEILRTYDTPEGGFDALLQSMVCQNEIGWRERSRRLLVFVTDAHSHLAGNGRLGGVIRPNDGKCHLNSNSGMYEEATNQDYPSIGQISRLAKDNAINLIFAVTDIVMPAYHQFTKFISGSSVGVLDQDSANIVELIRDTYEKIASTVEMKDTATDGVKLRYYTACKGNLVQENNKCENLKVGDVINFIISIEATECPTLSSKQIFEIYPVGVNEVLTMELETICDCPCEKPGNPDFVANATQCNFGGDYKCGVCECDTQHSGQNCECSADDNVADLESQCKPDNTTLDLCSNHGDCVCGKCECRPRPNPSEVISGKYCECDNYSCDFVDGIICSGNGVCNCKKCLCSDGWKGEACDCKTTKETCIPIGGGDVCSGNGDCYCGSCKCKPEAQGSYCEDCPTCPSRCEEFKPCVQCKVFETGPYMANNQAKCIQECIYPIEVQETVTVEQTSERDCSYENEQKCTVKYVYGFDSNGAKRVRVKRDPDCPTPVPALAIGLGLLGAIVLAGLIFLLFIRISTYLYDKREYARFVNERGNAKWNTDNNPIYVEPTQTFKNPTYNS